MDHQLPTAPSTELQALLDAIDKQEFKALSTGLGLGGVRPAGMPKTRYPNGARGPVHQATAADAAAWSTAGTTALPPLTAALPTPAASSTQDDAASAATTRGGPGASLGPGSTRFPNATKGAASSPRPNPTTPRQAGLSRLLLAWSLDLLFVAVTLAGALAAAFAAHAWRSGQTSWLTGKPVQWLLGLNPLLSLAAVYALFLVYALFFRVLVGRTCGETLLGIRPTPRLKQRKA